MNWKFNSKELSQKRYSFQNIFPTADIPQFQPVAQLVTPPISPTNCSSSSTAKTCNQETMTTSTKSSSLLSPSAGEPCTSVSLRSTTFRPAAAALGDQLLLGESSGPSWLTLSLDFMNMQRSKGGGRLVGQNVSNLHIRPSRRSCTHTDNNLIWFTFTHTHTSGGTPSWRRLGLG